MTRPSEPPALDDLYVIAKIARPRGIKGEVIADLLTDFPDRLEQLSESKVKTWGIWPGGEVRPVEIERAWLLNGRVVLKFAGCETEDSAELYRGVSVAIVGDDLEELPPDTWYHFDLIGCDVATKKGESIGTVERVEEFGAAPLLVVKGGRELLIPLSLSICIDIDIERKRITIDPPEGLLEL
jgi:16S rRNA processing protein RimM